ncbi:MAG: hypothetical protein KF784_13885 [Fimbriimonadaceae bacterium]|nr:hypothetical protein [Fimbriimonadaceae bacterium]
MPLNAYAAEKRLMIFEQLKQGLPPSEGEFDEQTFLDAKVKGLPQMGTTRYEPQAIYLEFIYPDPQGGSAIVTVKLDAPERIIFLPVPEWVIESIWQGDIDGSYHFESDAQALVAKFEAELTADGNEKWFGKQMAKRRE